MSRKMTASLGLLAILPLVGCLEPVESESEAAAAARAYLGNRQAAGDMNKVEVLDWGETWRVTFGDLEDPAARTTIVVVRKRNGEIVHMETRP